MSMEKISNVADKINSLDSDFAVHYTKTLSDIMLEEMQFRNVYADIPAATMEEIKRVEYGKMKGLKHNKLTPDWEKHCAKAKKKRRNKKKNR